MTNINKEHANDNFFNFDVTTRAMEELINLLASETESLKENDAKAVQENYQRKLDLIKFIEIQNVTLKTKQQVKDSLKDDEKQKLKDLAQKLQDVLATNKDELAKAKYFNEELMKLVVNAVKSESMPVKVYNAQGNKQAANSRKVDTPSVSLNKEV